jgi:uncharacterized protein (DUF58 family)
MQVTRRFWGLAGVGGALVALAVLFARPVLFFGGAAIGAFLLFQQYRFYRTLRRTDDALTVEQTLPSQYVLKGEATQVLLDARLATPSSLTLEISARPPVIAESAPQTERTLTLDPGTQDAQTTFAVTWSVVGRGTFSPATVVATDGAGLFRETLPRGSEPTIVVEPRTPRSVHVGEGGDQVNSSYGGHRSDRIGSGTDPAELRQYVPGDSVSDIDWKATARLDTPHVRQYEVETDRQSVLVVDHRARLRSGVRGETRFEYLREVALSFAENAADLNDPLGLAVVEDGGVSAWHPPSTDAETYNAIRRDLQDLTVSDSAMGDESTPRTATGTSGPETARRKAALLAGENSAYEHRVRPFLTDSTGYVQRMDGDPLFETVRTNLSAVAGATWAVILTDDAERRQLRETVKLARQQATSVAVFLTPTALFDRAGMADVDDAYQRYVEFEEFRRELARLEGVTAYEVGPGDRVEAVLAAGRNRRE